MVWRVSIRDTKALEDSLGRGEVEIPSECVNNSIVVRTILEQGAARVWPKFRDATERDLELISGSVAYLMRPDLLKYEDQSNFYSILTPGGNLASELEGEETFTRIRTREGKIVTLRNNPAILTPEWVLPEDYKTNPAKMKGAEWFRCFSATREWLPEEARIRLGFDIEEIKRRIEQKTESNAAFPLADMALFLYSPSDLTDYQYTEEEIRDFSDTNIRRASEI